ncbi:BpuSI family type II restriction endonuclease [Flavobacterium aestuarii]|uniref:BpuSI family type II restriction endonuclease n=1 Tax=Flavobacterium aestuarii TaxID=3149227 RepID=UPI0032B4698F
MINLWYNSEEVNDFHPLVQTALNNALVNCGYNNIAEVVHHPAIPNSTIIPDFAIRLIASQRYVFIVEVKRTQRDVESQRYQNQSRSYVTDFGPHWEPNYHKYFCVTNIERLVLLADRNGVPLTSCLLKGNPRQHSLFNPVNHDATASVAELQITFENILPNIFNRVAPDYDNNWEPIIESFHNNYIALKNSLGYPEAVKKELTLYELFRLLAYAYLKDYYTQTGSANAAHFHNYPPNNATLPQFKNNLVNNYNRIIQLDFRQIFTDHPNQALRIFPDNFSVNYLQYFRDLIQSFIHHNSNAVANNPSPSYVFNLLTSKIYVKEELHRKGKVMSDTELSNLLAALCIDTPDSRILDPGCGDGALLDAAYDQISLLAVSANQAKTHNQILNQIDGIEIDPFLSQLSAFRLLSKNLAQVNNTTAANILIGDIFHNTKPNYYDAVLMNPPFLRNDNPEAPITAADKVKMKAAITGQGLNYFVADASQPNLYFYFTNYIWHYLRNNGKAGIILMTKFLNNEDGEHLKQFISDKVEAIISYPRKYFQEFVVTSVIVILKKGNNSANVSFMRVSDENVLLNPDNLKAILTLNADTTTAAFKLRVVPRNTLVASENWRLYLLDQKFENFISQPFLIPIENHFDKIKRGNAEAAGGSKLIFPSFDANTNSYFANGSKPNENVINIDNSLTNFIGYGIKNNDTRRHYTLQTNDLQIEQAFHFPAKADTNTNNMLSAALSGNAYLASFYNDCVADFGADKWKSIINNSVNHTYCPKIVIPRADRKKHCVYYNPLNSNFTLSTNFFYCDDLKNKNNNATDEEQYKFTTAFLLSAFGQIQFELNANNHEGLRKLEGFQIKKFRIPDMAQFTHAEILAVVVAFDALNVANPEFSGDEGLATPRRNLDLAIGTIIFQKDNLGFATVVDMVNDFELFLADLVEDRRI